MNYENVRLIAADMDGTLLNSRQELPVGFFDILPALRARGIHMTIASGRSCPTLRRQFADVLDQLILLCENGACIIDQGDPLFTHRLSSPQVDLLTQMCREIDRVWLVYSGYRAPYMLESTPAEIRRFIALYYKDAIYVRTPQDIPEPVIKITVYDPDGSEHHSLALLKDRLPEGVGCSLDGPFWTNLGPGGISKGTGIAGIQAHFGLTPDQTMIFGDYLNDYDMMPLAHFSYAMANAHPDLKAICRYETLSNDDDGVMYILRQLLAGK